MSKTVKKNLKEICFFVFFGGCIAYFIILFFSPNIVREEILQAKYYVPDGDGGIELINLTVGCNNDDAVLMVHEKNSIFSFGSVTKIGERRFFEFTSCERFEKEVKHYGSINNFLAFQEYTQDNTKHLTTNNGIITLYKNKGLAISTSLWCVDERPFYIISPVDSQSINPQHGYIEGKCEDILKEIN